VEKKKSELIKLWLVLLVCVAPLVAAYVTYYIIKPQSRTNYGTLLDPAKYPMPQVEGINHEGKKQPLTQWKGKWVLLQVGPSLCEEVCQKNLYHLRQLRLAQGKERDRLVRVWLVTDGASPSQKVMQEHEGLNTLAVSEAVLDQWLPREVGAQWADHIYIIDPLGNLMMRYPKNSDPNKMKKDISKLLKASSIG
jgi:peroxiredoxin